MTDDHRMLEALERSTRELTAILDTASIGIAVVRNREFVRCNRRFEELFDLEAGSLVGSSARVLFDSDEEYERIGQQVYAEFAAGQVHHREQLHRRSDGRDCRGCGSAAAFRCDHPACRFRSG
ncbi:MAG: PAS domain-containing protein [Sulfuritalea sp.]|nr:PAS domain-containing protein [Sulfuritalea sp.]